jgi:membrane fusion protein, heavy metal efflux system
MSEIGENEDTKPTGNTVKESKSVENSRRQKVIIFTVLGLVILALVALWFWFNRGGKAGQPVSAPRTTGFESSAGSSTNSTAEMTLSIDPSQLDRSGIKVERVGEQLSSSTTAAGTGVVQSNAYRETPVVSLVAGIVRRVNAELGEYVNKGKTLVIVFSDDLSMAQSEYLKSVAELDEHHKHHKRTARLVEIGAASREEFEMATTKLKSAEAEVASKRQRLLFLGVPKGRINSLRSSTQVSSEVALSSPITGTVISRTVNPGEVVEANKELLRISDLSSVWVIGQVHEKDLGQIRVGSGVTITSTAYPERVFRGRISYVDPRLDPQTRTAQVRIELANPGQMFKIGMFVDIAFATIGGSESTSPVVPVNSVQQINNQQIVFVATNEPNVFLLRPVRLGPESNGYYPVLEGLMVDDRIVTEGSFMLRAEWLKTHPGGN